MSGVYFKDSALGSCKYNQQPVLAKLGIFFPRLKEGGRGGGKHRERERVGRKNSELQLENFTVQEL